MTYFTKSVLTILLVIINSMSGNTQTLKTYSGPYNIGKATYQYNEVANGERIYQGTCNFNYNGNEIVVAGQYKKNKPEGDWVITYNKHTIFFTSVNGVIKGSFLNGNRNGNWYSKFSSQTAFEGSTGTASTTTNYIYSNNHLVGDFSEVSSEISNRIAAHKNGVPLMDNQNIRESTIGHFDSEGYRTGEWTILKLKNNFPSKEIKKYKKGFCYFSIKRNEATGEIISKFDSTQIADLVFPKITNQQTDVSITIDSVYYILSNPSQESRMHLGNLDQGLDKVFPNIENPENINSGERHFILINNLREERIANERLTIAQKKEQERIAQMEKEKELLEEKKRLQNEFEESDYGKLQNNVKKEFQVWLQKTDFETIADYETRIKTQSENKYSNILSQKVEESKKKNFHYSFAQIGKYDSENESYLLIWNKSETTNIKVSRQISKEFYLSFNGEESQNVINNELIIYHGNIYVYPTKLIMIDNTWKVSDAIIILNNYYWGNGDRNPLSAKNVYKKNGSYFVDREKSGQLSTTQLIDFNSIQNATMIPNKVFYLDIHINNSSREQPLNFSYNDLKKSIP